jgi:glycosyltransferase involved in cell wall biosynthesis
MFNNSIFSTNKEEIIFLADYFSDEYEGGAELSTESLFKENKTGLTVKKIKCSNLDLSTIQNYKDSLWVFFNCSTLDLNLLNYFINSNIKYVIVEYDYKFCMLRSPKKHKKESGSCNCQNSELGQFWEMFMQSSRHIFWMSKQQSNIYFSRFPNLINASNSVLSSLFDTDFFNSIEKLRNNTKNNKYIILKSPSWVKGYEDSLDYCKRNKIVYEEVWGLPNKKLLNKLSESKGMVFLPRGEDTCPRIVIEAKLLGLDIITNDNVQNSTEDWFQNVDETKNYLKTRPEHFWSKVLEIKNRVPKISGYTTSLNWIKNDYPWRDSVKSLLGFCDEVIILDGGSTDGTREELKKLQELDSRIKIYFEEYNWTDPRSAVFDGKMKADARKKCNYEFCWQMDADEIIVEKDYQKIKNLVLNWQNNIDLLALPLIEFWGAEKIRVDVNPWKWRISKNKSHITHGIPISLRSFDDNGKLFAKQGTDGCDYINSASGEVIPCTAFQNLDILLQTQQLALQNIQQYIDLYENYMNQIVDNLPTIRHYSWFDIKRKIIFYRDFWQRHWESLYNIKIEDTAENNKFFDKKWSDISEEEIEELAKKLESKTGGHIFHKKFNEKETTPWIKIKN